MSRISRQSVFTGILLVCTLGVVLGLNESLICEDRLNPFQIPSQGFQVPIENGLLDEDSEVLLALEWIPRELVGCEVNHNDKLKNTLNVLTVGNTVSLTPECKTFIRNYQEVIKSIVRRNLITAIRAEAVDFFNKYKRLKRFVMKKGEYIMNLDKDHLFDKLDTTSKIINNGYTFPITNDLPTPLIFNSTFLPLIEKYHHVGDVSTAAPEIKINKDSRACTDGVCRHLVYELIDRNQLWGGKQKTMEEAIKLVRTSASFQIASFYVAWFQELILPMIPPCFEDQSMSTNEL